MRMRRLFYSAALALVFFGVAGGAVACAPADTGGTGEPSAHMCESVCTVCGGCLNAACTDPACADKCEGHVYTFTSTKEELFAANEYQAAFVTATGGTAGAFQSNSLTLHSGGTYTLVKAIECVDVSSPMAISVEYTFYGNFEKEGETVTLSYPSSGKRESDWGMMSAAVPSVERGTVTSEENASILRQFPSAYFLMTAAGGISQTVTVDEAGGSVLWQAVDPAYWGNSPAYDPENVTSIGDTALKGKTIGYLGSSVTYGASAGGVSFVEYIAKHLQTSYVKEAVSGTTLVDNGENSYISRLEAMDTAQPLDLFVCQLSTNDANTDSPLGQIAADGEEPFDTSTVAGAIEHIIVYIRDTFNCPIVFYTNAYYGNSRYAAMVDLLKTAQEKYGIGVIDLYTDGSFNELSETRRQVYMADDVHPTKAGYLLWWTPVMETYLTEYYENIRQQ